MSKLPTIMFYDGGCALCSREVRLYRRLDRKRRIRFVDISRDTAPLRTLGIAPETAMRRLHVRSGDGLITSGAYAFAALWREIPLLRPVAGALSGLRLLPTLDKCYQAFAVRRYARRCGSCGSPKGTALACARPQP